MDPSWAILDLRIDTKMSNLSDYVGGVVEQEAEEIPSPEVRIALVSIFGETLSPILKFVLTVKELHCSAFYFHWILDDNSHGNASEEEN